MTIMPKPACACYSDFMRHLLLSLIAISAAFAAEPTTTTAQPYPLDKCVVSDEKLGSMGKPFIFKHEGQEVRLCCQECRKEFDTDPKKFLAKLASKPALPDKPSEAPSAPQGATIIKVLVDGMVCNFCATNIHKSFEKNPAVAYVYVNLKQKTILLTLKPSASVSDDEIRTVVTEAGFTPKEIKRTEGTFEKAKDDLKKGN